jgi:hypothetical protein
MTASQPFIIRPANNSADYFEFLGNTCIGGITYSEALEMREAKEMRAFTLVWL